MRTKLLLTTIFIIVALLFFNCSQEKDDNATAPIEETVFQNPYSYIGTGHNEICQYFLENNLKNDFPKIAEMSKDYLLKTKLYSNINTDYLVNTFSKYLNMNNNLNKITDNDWLDNFYANFVNEGIITEKSKEQILNFLDYIEEIEEDTNKINDYCTNLSSDIDDTTKSQIFIIASIYNASYRLWIGNDNLPKNSTPNKTQAIVAVDATGAAIGSILYIVYYTYSGGDWSWEDCAYSALSGAIWASLGG